MEHARAFYKERKTLGELYAEDATIFEPIALHLPQGVNLSTISATLLAEYADLDTIIAGDADILKAYHAVWAARWAASWGKMAAALNADYNPIHNYDRTDTETETIEGTASGTSSSSGSSSGTESSTESGSESRESYGAGFNSSTASGAAVPVGKDVTTPGRTVESETSAESENSSETSSETNTGRERELHSSGNIGVTTTQQMLESELNLRSRYNIYDVIIACYRKDILVGVW